MAIVCLGLIASSPESKWKYLGARSVNYELDKDIIRVGLNERGFKRLKVVVRGGGLNMHRMEVVYGNETRDNIPLRCNFNRRSDSKIIGLKGGKRIIEKIVFWYDTKNLARRKAKVVVYGGR